MRGTLSHVSTDSCEKKTHKDVIVHTQRVVWRSSSAAPIGESRTSDVGGQISVLLKKPSGGPYI